ncbi:MAG: OmpA family protein [Lutibacter sp.]|uniref:OmpA family protein n=1 Tax=Lutibacter sp. TaxID=1925666 RepID=UPI00385C6A69
MKHITELILLLFFNTLFSQQVEYEVHTTSINSKDAEFGITYLNGNTVLFASSKKNNNDKNFKKDRRKNNRQLYLEIYKAIINNDGDLIQANQFSSENNNKFFESDISFTPDRKIIYFTWNNFYNTLTRKDSAKWRTLQLMRASIDDNFELSNITHLPFNSKEYSVRSPEISKDGSQLFFVSDMPNGYGKNDIYVVDIKNDTLYSTPKNLGKNINTNQDELYPFADRNNVLYFSSYGHKGKGRLDIFKSTFEKGIYNKVENLQSPFNSSYDDFAFVINDLKNTGYFTSNRKGGKGGVDIYAFKLKNKECFQKIKGFIIDKNTGQPLNNAKVSLLSNNALLESKIISNGNSYSFSLKCEENYTILAEKENFTPTKVEFTTTKKINDSLTKNIQLLPIECNQIVAGLLSNKNTGQPLNNVKVSLLSNNTLLESKIISNGNSYSFSLKCKENYTILAEKENFETSNIEIATNSINNHKIDKLILLIPIKCLQKISGTILDNKTKNPIPNSIVTIFKDDLIINTLKTAVNANYSFAIDCNNYYKIVASAVNYENTTVFIKTSNIPNESTNKLLHLKSNVKFVTSRGKKMIKTNIIYFDLDDDAIRKDAAIELNKVINLLKNNPSIKIEIASHTDSRAPDNYNLNLSEKRANSVLNYIILKGINSNRLTSKGYGETQLINKCSNGVKCTEVQHQMNRRTEFVIIDE